MSYTKKSVSFVSQCAAAVLTVALGTHAALAQGTAVTGPAQGAQPTLSDEQVKTLRHDMETALHYPLKADVLPRLTNTLKAIHAANIQPPGRVGMSLDEQIAMVEKVPGLDAILKANNFTARDFVMSLTCVGLTGSLMNVTPNQQTAQMAQPDPKNVALLKANQTELQDLIAVLRTAPAQ